MTLIVRETVPYFMPNGTHLVTISDIQETPDLEDSERVKLQIELQTTEEIEGAVRTARFWTSPSLHPKGRLKPFVEATLGRKLSEEELRNGFDILILLGQNLRVLVKESTSQKGKLYAKIVEFFPADSK